MNHTATHRSKVVRVTLGVAASIGFATLTACGSTAKSSQEVDTVAPAISVVSDTLSLPADVATTTSIPAAPTTVASAVTATTATPKVVPVPAAAAVAVIDPALAQALKDAEALLGANGQDLNDAATAAANGG